MNRLVSETDRICLVAGYTDMRLGIDGLSSLVQYRFNMDSRSSCLFLFCGRRADRIKGLLLSEDKYKDFYKRFEQLIAQFSDMPLIDLNRLYQIIVFSFLTGNSDMHLNSFSLIESKPGCRVYQLVPAYDLLPVNLI